MRSAGRSSTRTSARPWPARAGSTAVTERIAALIKERRPGIIAIDSFKALAAFADDAREFRRFLHELAALLTAFPATTFWIGEYSEDETRTAPEFAVADGIISLATERASERTLRLIQVTKLRGSDFRSGRHAYRLSEDGITVFPRLADPIRDDDYRLGEERISSGIAPLDPMLAEGYAPGSSTLVAGPSGAGKTLMGLHFIFSGAANGEPGVIATLQENPIQLQRVARGFGWSLDDERVAVMYRSPNDVYIDEWVYELLELIETTGATRVMIDSLSDLQYATPDPVRFREFIYSLTQRLSRAGISPIMTSEIPDLFHVGRLAEYGISHLSDNVILLQYLRAEFGAQVLQQDDVVGEVRDAVFGEAADVEEVGYLAGHDRADAGAREALRERVDEFAEAHGIWGRVLQVAEAVDHDARGAGGLDRGRAVRRPIRRCRRRWETGT